MSVVPLETALRHLRLEPDDDDPLVGVYLDAAEQAAADFLNRQFYASPEDLAAAVLDGSSGDDPIVVNGAIKAAVLLILGRLYGQREDVVVGVSVAELPQGAHSLLWPHRIGLGV